MEMPVVEKKENKTGAIIGTIAAIVLCGCPGLGLCLIGVLGAFGMIPDTFQLFSNYGNLPNWIGFIFLCVSLLFIAIAVVVPILLLRKKKDASVEILTPQEPLPPAA
jgi:hypothetical protein